MKIALSVVGALVFLVLFAFLFAVGAFAKWEVGIYNHFSQATPIESLQCGDIKLEHIRKATKYITDAGGFKIVNKVPDSSGRLRLVTPTGEVTLHLFQMAPSVEGTDVYLGSSWASAGLPYDLSSTELASFEATHSISFNKSLELLDMIGVANGDTSSLEKLEANRNESGAAFIGLPQSLVSIKEFESLKTCRDFVGFVLRTKGEMSFGKDVFIYLKQ